MTIAAAIAHAALLPTEGAPLAACFGHALLAERAAAYAAATAGCAARAVPSVASGFEDGFALLLQVAQTSGLPVRDNRAAFAALASWDESAQAVGAGALPRRNPLAFLAAFDRGLAKSVRGGAMPAAEPAFLAAYAAALAVEDQLALALAADLDALRLFQIALAWRTERRIASVVEARQLLADRAPREVGRWLFAHHVTSLAGCAWLPDSQLPAIGRAWPALAVDEAALDLFRRIGALLVYACPAEADQRRAALAFASPSSPFAVRHTGGLAALFAVLGAFADDVESALTPPR